MKCPRCQNVNPAEAISCGVCGVPLAASCSACGATNPPANRFCGECGAPLTADVGAGRFASPGSYTPKHLAEMILTSRAALEGERKQVTVLFADMKGSMELLADRDPEEARRVLDPVLELMMEAVHLYEGTVNQVMGDGIMALFGAPVAHEDHAVRACYAALRMQESVKRYAGETQPTRSASPQIRIGLNSGDVVVRSIGNDLRMDYTAVGQTTHLAARMEQMAMPRSILMMGETLRLAEGYVEVKSLGPMPVRGLVEPVEIYELTGAAPIRRRFEAAAIRGLTRFVGRTAELDQLRTALEQARRGHGQVVGVVGEPGVGKSRLFFEFVHSRLTPDWLVLESGAVSYGKATPYLPLIDLLRMYFRIESWDDARRIREKVTGQLSALDRALEPALPAMLALLDVPVGDAQWQGLDPQERRQRTLEALQGLLLGKSRTRPLCLVFEDLHWIDSETQAFLDSVVEALPATAVLLLINYRPEYHHGWGAKGYYTQLRMEPLPQTTAQELLDELLGEDPALRALKRRLIEHTEGNPFFLEECVRALVETRVLVRDRGAYRVTEPWPSVEVPATVQAVLAARIDRLPPAEKHLLQSAAVIGEHGPVGLLQAIVDLPEEEVHAGLARLKAAEFLYEARLFPEPEYAFKHGLTYRVAYRSLLHERRQALHARLVEAIERVSGDRLFGELERLAHHSFEGAVWEKAVRYARQAAAKVYGRSAAAAEAVVLYERALRALGRLPETRARLTEAVDLRLAIRTPLAQLLEHERIRDHLREAERLATVLADRRRLGRIYTFITAVCFETADYEGARGYGARALEFVTAEGDWEIEFVVRFFLAQIAFASGDHREALNLYEHAVAIDASHKASPRSGVFVNRLPVVAAWSAMCLAELGRFAEAAARAQDALQLAPDDPFNRVVAYLGIGRVHLERGELAPSVTALEEALDLCRRTNNLLYLVQVAAALGYARVLSGVPAEGLALLETAESQARARRPAVLAPILAWQSEAHLLAGRVEQARSVAGQALVLARDRGERGHQARALHLLGKFALDGDPPDLGGAELHLRQGLGRAEALGMRPLLAHCHLGLGRLGRRAGDLASARAHLTTAAAMYREMEMRLGLAQAEGELGGLG